MKRYKYQGDAYDWIAFVILLISALDNILGIWYSWIIYALAYFSILVFSYKRQIYIKNTSRNLEQNEEKVFKHKMPYQPNWQLYEILGMLFPLIFATCVLLQPFFEIILYIYWALLFVSMIVCMCTCKEEDAKSIALLHVMYMTSCALAAPVWWTIK